MVAPEDIGIKDSVSVLRKFTFWWGRKETTVDV
jgi:hypothetical protein